MAPSDACLARYRDDDSQKLGIVDRFYTALFSALEQSH